jgi:hypothetical protein
MDGLLWLGTDSTCGLLWWLCVMDSPSALAAPALHLKPSCGCPHPTRMAATIFGLEAQCKRAATLFSAPMHHRMPCQSWHACESMLVVVGSTRQGSGGLVGGCCERGCGLLATLATGWVLTCPAAGFRLLRRCLPACNLTDLCCAVAGYADCRVRCRALLWAFPAQLGSTWLV